MNSLSAFLNNMDWWGLLEFLLQICVVLLCLTVHELSHGLVAYKLGDPTAKEKGRLTLNPVKHIDPFGFIMMLTVHVGWAKPVPVDMRYFKKPKQGMALTALAGPVSNFVFAVLAGGLLSVLLNIMWTPRLLLYFLMDLVIMNVGLGIFNLFPIPPLDGSKVLFSFLPTKAYLTILRYEKYVMGVLMLLLWFGVFDRPLNWLIGQGLHLVGVITRCPLFL